MHQVLSLIDMEYFMDNQKMPIYLRKHRDVKEIFNTSTGFIHPFINSFIHSFIWQMNEWMKLVLVSKRSFIHVMWRKWSDILLKTSPSSNCCLYSRSKYLPYLPPIWLSGWQYCIGCFKRRILRIHEKWWWSTLIDRRSCRKKRK